MGELENFIYDYDDNNNKFIKFEVKGFFLNI